MRLRDSLRSASRVTLALAIGLCLLPLMGLQAQAPAWSQGVPYTYDAAGNVVSIGNDVQTYDRMGRLATSETNGVRTGFTYDAFGNRVTCLRSTGADCQYGLDIDNGTNQIVDATYDSAGNVIAFDGHAFSYDVLNMQTSDIGAGVERDYVYTPTEERIAVYTPGTGAWRWTLRDASNRLLREFTSEDGSTGHGTDSWRWSKDYIWRDNLLLATRQIEPGSTSVSTYYYHLDHLGSPRVITNQSNAVVGGHSYHAFGPETSDGLNEPSLTSLQYTAHERDGEFDSMHARYYSAKLGRFLSPDPVLGNLLQPGSWNRYAYVLNDPVNFVDPAGLRPMNYGGYLFGGNPILNCTNDDPRVECHSSIDVTPWEDPADGKTITFRDIGEFFRWYNEQTERFASRYIGMLRRMAEMDFDYYTLTVGLDYPGTKFGLAGTITMDRYGRVYYSKIAAVSAGVGLPGMIVNGSLTAGTLMQAKAPSPSDLKSFLTGHAITFSNGMPLGGAGFTISPFSNANTSSIASEIGIYTPQIGLQYSYGERMRF
ncbi:MAG TPA: RHS repeat-associated core domain-containing protein [Thermoanaerobaculia bacterium]|nr:RHS repeat-associated core domain-containing protein [Thermoanaerobaculia bacterium]